MAKTSVNPLSIQRRLTKLRRQQQWTRTELEALPAKLEAKQSGKLNALARKLDRKLVKSAFDACDKGGYADFHMEEQLHRFDVKQYMDYRAVNHGCAKEIFKAIRAGQDWSAALASHDAAVEKLQQKREAYRKSLEGKKEAFLAKHSGSDDTAYKALQPQLQAEYESGKQQLEAGTQQRLDRRSKALQAKLDRCESRMSQLKKASKTKQTLPEDVLLRVEGLKMYFGGLKAVDDLSFDVKKGEIFGLIGPNGAGKTTVFNCITRFYNATGGDMYFENKHGEVVDLRSFQVHDVIVQGITRTFQNVELVKEISVLENLLVACTQDYRSNLLVQALGLPSLKKEEQLLKEKAKKVLKFMGLESYSSWLATGLPYGVLKKVEIARALMSDAKLIIMDEPAAGLNDTETAELTETIRRIRDEFGVTILLVEHDMGLVMNVCDTVCAISFGRMLAIGSCDEIKKNKAVQEAYLGVEEDA